MNYQFRLIDSQLQDQIVKLRKEVFQRKYGTLVDVKGLEWNRTDQFGTHIAAYNQDELVSILRLSYIDTADTFEKLLQFPPDHPFSNYPSFCLSRAATSPAVEGKNLNMALRLLAFRLVLKSPKPSQFIYGTTMANSKRIQMLKDLGYEVEIHKNAWRGYLSSGDKPIAIFRLPREKLSDAIAYLSNTYTSSELIKIKLES